MQRISVDRRRYRLANGGMSLRRSACALLIACAAPVQAAELPTVTVGGDLDVAVGNATQSNRGQTQYVDQTPRDVQAIYDLLGTGQGKAGDLSYGALAAIGDGPDISNYLNGDAYTPYLKQGYGWISGAPGKLQLGDSRGSADLNVVTPSIGEGQAAGNFGGTSGPRYMNFLNTSFYAKNLVLGVDGDDHSAGVTYVTPAFSMGAHTLRAAATFIPQFYDFGGSLVDLKSARDTATSGSNTYSPYRNVGKGTLAYSANLAPVALAASIDIVGAGDGDRTNTAGPNDTWLRYAPTGTAQGFVTAGFGVKAAWEGFTLGGGYHDLGRYNTVTGQNRAQNQYTAGLTYEIDRYAIGINYLGGQGYANILSTGTAAAVGDTNYVRQLNSYGIGASYIWQPGLVTALDAVAFDQNLQNGTDNHGYTVLLAQRLAF